ncbi:hypothetical protein ACS5PN_19205 [Roseateles sp. NT4]|uniref:hypothetical protein n=1 Tax=Roseateles sp. NT4 TaxID=3453715 RepID=UPI003EEC7B6F
MESDAHILVENAGEPAPLVVTFGFALWDEPAAFDFVGRLRKVEWLLGRRFHRIHLRDPRMAWYLQGITGLGENLDTTLDALRRHIAALPATRMTMLGQSMGGYGAILYGLALGADRVIALGSLSTMDPADASARGDWRWLPVMQRLAAEGIAASQTDLVALARQVGALTELRLHYGERPDTPEQGARNLDLFHAERFATLPGCRVIRHADSDHVVVNHLKAIREIDAVLLHEIFDVDPGSLHRRTQPLLDDSWLRWIAENRLRSADRDGLVAAMLERGMPAITARSAIAEVERDPVFLAAEQVLSAR